MFDSIIYVPVCHTTSSDGCLQVAVHVCEKKAGDLVMFLLHGAGSSAMTWHQQGWETLNNLILALYLINLYELLVSRLKHCCTLVAPDLRSHGISDYSFEMGINDLVNDIGDYI